MAERTPKRKPEGKWVYRETNPQTNIDYYDFVPNKPTEPIKREKPTSSLPQPVEDWNDWERPPIGGAQE
jgi:hypothetical protein